MAMSPVEGYSDRELLEFLRKHDFGGPFWEQFVNHLVRHGLVTLTPWIRGKRIFGELRRRGIQCYGRVAYAEEVAQDLALDAIAHAIEPFRRMLRRGWDPDGAASLKTAFIEGCLQQFPNCYSRWIRQALGKNLEKIASLPGDDEIVKRLEEGGGDRNDPEELVISEMEQNAMLDLLPDRLRAVIQLHVGQGLTFLKAAEALGENPKKLRKQLERMRPALRRMWTQRDEEGGL